MVQVGVLGLIVVGAVVKPLKLLVKEEVVVVEVEVGNNGSHNIQIH